MSQYIEGGNYAIVDQTLDALNTGSMADLVRLRTEHRHICKSKFHEGPRVRIHFARDCYEPYDDTCLECHDLELEAAGARWETADSPSDADPGL